MEYVHSKEIVHLDIKPSNILYEKSTNEITLIDFGLACTVGQCEPGGTLQYMAPEVLDEQRDITYAADIWSIGATFYEWVSLYMLAVFNSLS
jgi:serine/threonine protein kinase